MQKESRIIILIIMSLFLLKSVFSLSFVSQPLINNETETAMPLYCSWNSSTDTVNVNVSWYNSSLIYSETTTTLSYATLGQNIVKRGEIWICKVKLNNGTATLEANYSVTITNGNPKNFKIYNTTNNTDLGNNTLISEDISYNLYINATDPDNDVIMFTSLSLPAWGNLNQNTGAVTLSPSESSDAGVYNVTFIALDTGGGIKRLDFSINVTAVNDAPVFSTLVAQTATEGIYFQYNISAGDEENNFPLTFEIINDSNIGLSIQNISNEFAMLYFTPQFIDTGSHTITLRVTDSSNGSTESQFVLNIISVNHIPNFSYIENSSGMQGGPFLMQINASDIDINDNLSIIISSSCQNTPNIWTLAQLSISANNSVAVINVTNLTNNHILCRNVTISVTDNKQGSIYSLDMVLNITNTNDAPIIYENSSYSSNSHNNTNIYNLTAYQNVNFSYTLNFTDPDLLTYEGDNVSVSTNFTGFTDVNITINSTSGKINFNTDDIGTYNIYVEANDSQGLKANKTLILEVKAHTLPVIISVCNFTINESELFNCTINASGSSNLNYFTNASNLFTINSTTGLISFTPSQSEIGNHSINIWVQDELSGINMSAFNLEIINKNDAPVLYDFSDFNQIPLVVGHAFFYAFTATDNDLNLPAQYSYDYLTFFTNSSIFTVNPSTGNLFFTPDVLMIGNYSIIIQVNDSIGLTDNITINFTIYNVSIPPVIMNITPFGTPVSNYTNFSWISTSNFNGSTSINVSENTSVIFNHTTFNPENDETVNYTWFVNGVEKSMNYSFEYSFDFSSAGIVNITLLANDSHYSSSNFTWVVNVTDINNPVQFLNNPQNRTGNKTISGQTMVIDFLMTRSPDGVFYDPDDDLNSDGRIDGSETNNLIFTYTWGGDGLSDAVNIEINSTDVLFTPLKTAQATYTFTASDGKSNATTDKILLNLTMTSQNNSNNNQNSQNNGGSGSGGSGSGTATTTKTKTKEKLEPQEIEKIKTLNIITPKSVVMYDNNTVVIPITLKNSGNKTLNGINLSAHSNNSEVSMHFDQDFFEKLLVNSEESTNLTVNAYRSQGTYEITIDGQVDNPIFNDSAVVLISSIQEQDAKNLEKSTKTMITFARDLLSSNPKCLELNEMFKDIENDLIQKNYDNAQRKIDEIVSTCRYLTSEKTLFNEEPKNIYVSMQKIRNNPILFYTMVGVIMSCVLGIGYSVYYTNRKMKM